MLSSLRGGLKVSSDTNFFCLKRGNMFQSIPVKELNDALKETGWTVGKIYRARFLQIWDIGTEIRDESAKLYDFVCLSKEQEEQANKVRLLRQKRDEIVQED